MRKILPLFLCALLLLSITACQMSERTPADELRFLRAAEELSLSTGDSTDTYFGSVDVEKAVYATNQGNCYIEFVRCSDLSEAVGLYQYLVSAIEDSGVSGTHQYSSTNLGTNYSRYHCVVDGVRYRFVRIEKTVLYAQYSEDDIPTVRALCRELHYE